MVKALGIVAVLAGTAAAEAPDKLVEMGFRFGAQEIGDDSVSMIGLSLAGERRITGVLRGGLEYEYLWLGKRVTEEMELEGSGHRLQLGARVTVLETAWSRKNIRWYVDAEGGGGVLYAKNQPVDRAVKAHAFVGLRAGYDFINDLRTIASTRFESIVIARVIASEDGPGVMFGIGFGWGD